jgi:hypothetical protein
MVKDILVADVKSASSETTGSNGFCGGVSKKKISSRRGQMKIQQMSFMIVAVFIFFVLVGLFFVNFQLREMKRGANEINRDQTLLSLEVIAQMPELSCGGSRVRCIDEDKLILMSGPFGEKYRDLWPVSSIKVYKIYPAFTHELACPAPHCNHYVLYDDGQVDRQEYATYINVCRTMRDGGQMYEDCEVAKLSLGVRLHE